MASDHFTLNQIEVGFSDRAELRIARGKLAMRLATPPLRLTRALHNGQCDGDGTEIQDFFMEDGLILFSDQPVAIPGGTLPAEITWPHRDDTGYLRTLPVRGPYYTGGNFHGRMVVTPGQLELDGFVAFGGEIPDKGPVMPLQLRKSFVPAPLIPPRRRLDLRAALETAPDEVFELQIMRGNFDGFPEDIFTFRNLEMLWLRCGIEEAGGPLKSLPAALFDLAQLHTLRLDIYDADLGALPEAFYQLTQLEALHISGQGVTGVPAALARLPRLEVFDLSRNALRSFPEAVARMPSLRTLNLTDNPFETLPAALAQVPALRIDAPQRALFSDISYQSRNTAPVEETLFTLARAPDLAARLSGVLDRSALSGPQRDMVADLARLSVRAVPVAADGPLPTGTSKVGGCPDLPSGTPHPVDANGRYYTFYAQIDLAQIAGMQGFLPRTGMLSFFVDLLEQGPRVVVMHHTCAPSDLQRYSYGASAKWVDTMFDPERLVPQAPLQFCQSIALPHFHREDRQNAAQFPAYTSAFQSATWRREDWERFETMEAHIQDLRREITQADPMPDVAGGAAHEINGYVFSQGAGPSADAAARAGGHAPEWITLLSLNSIGGLNVWDAGTLSFSIHKADLAIADFSRVVASIYSS